MSAHLTPEQLSAHVDGELSANDRAPVDAHLALCAGCRADRAELQALDALARNVPDVAAPPGYFDTLPARVRARVAPPRRTSLPPWTLALAAGLVVAVAAPLALRQKTESPAAATRSDAPLAENPPPAAGGQVPLQASSAPAPKGPVPLQDLAAPAAIGGVSAQDSAAAAHEAEGRAQDAPVRNEAGGAKERAEARDARDRVPVTPDANTESGQAPGFAEPPAAPAPAATSPARRVSPRDGPAPSVDFAREAPLAEEIQKSVEPSTPPPAPQAKLERADRARQSGNAAPGSAPPGEAEAARREADGEAKGGSAAPRATAAVGALADPDAGRALQASFRALAARRPRSAAEARALREAWRGLLARPPAGLQDEARVRLIEAGATAYRFEQKPADLAILQQDAADYLADAAAPQAERVRTILKRIGGRSEPQP